MKKKWVVYLMALMMAVSVTGCGENTKKEPDVETEAGDNEEHNTTDNKENGEETGTAQESLPEETSPSDNLDEGADKNAEVGTAGEHTYGDISITFPEDWEGRFYVKQDEDYITIYQKASYDMMEELGVLFSISIDENPYYDYPSGGIFAYTEEKAYAVHYPTDVNYYYEIPEIAEEYGEMTADIKEILYSVKIQADDVQYNADEFILPMSEYYMLTEYDVINLSEMQLYFARNEIYARHGYHFEDMFLQACFERCSWYEDRGDAYSQEDLTEIDLANIETIRAMEEQKGNEYPMEFNVGEEYTVDLDHDNTEETIRYDVSGGEYNPVGIITVNGEAYDLADFGAYLWCPEEEHFYVTNIAPYSLGVEIAIADYGPSEDLATFFFTYDGELHYLGSVGGHPMEQLNHFNGFESNVVIGRVRSDLLGTTYGYGRWWYNGENAELEFQETGMYAQEPWYSHELLVDLPVYLSNNTESATVVMEAGLTVYQMYTDGKEWVQIRDENGVEGWVHIERFSVENVGMGIDSVFTNINFFD